MPCKRVSHDNSVCNDALCSALVHRILLSSPSLKAIVVDRTAGSTPSEVPSSWRRQAPFADAIRTQWASGGGSEPRAENLPKKVKGRGHPVVLS